MAKELIFGHQNPDTDAIGTAIAYSYLQNKLGYDTEAVALGEANDETKYALNKFGFTAPRVIKTASNEVDAVMLVDHNEPQQSVSDIDKVKVTHVVDHHRIMILYTTVQLQLVVPVPLCGKCTTKKKLKFHKILQELCFQLLSQILYS